MRAPLTSPGTGDPGEAVEVLPNDEREQRPVSARNGTRNGYGKPRRLAMSSGTITSRVATVADSGGLLAVMKLASRPAIFKSRHSDPELILCAVRGYLQSALPFREAAARLRARGRQADHTTLWRWVQRYGPERQAQPRRPRPPSPPDRLPPRRGGRPSSQTASAAARPAAFARLAGARRGLLRSAGALAAALLALSGALTLPATAEAQTVTLLSNRGVDRIGRVNAQDGYTYAQPFHTGTNTSGGYTLRRIVLGFNDLSIPRGTVTVTVREEKTGYEPSDNVLYTLTNPGTIEFVSEFIAPASARLDANTNYWVVLSTTGG